MVKGWVSARYFQGFEGVGEINTIGQIPNAHYFVAQQPPKYWERVGKGEGVS